MWMLKGAFLGLWVFAFGTLAYLFLTLSRFSGPNRAIGLSVLAAYTTWNPLWWAALAISIVAGCLITRSWRGKGWFWFALMVTFLFPAGLLALILAVTIRGSYMH
jgi:hypothetical protein